MPACILVRSSATQTGQAPVADFRDQGSVAGRERASGDLVTTEVIPNAKDPSGFINGFSFRQNSSVSKPKKHRVSFSKNEHLGLASVYPMSKGIMNNEQSSYFPLTAKILQKRI